jgi:hypothetical protein
MRKTESDMANDELAKVRRLQADVEALKQRLQNTLAFQSTFYICTRCGLLYQSIYGCGCANALLARAPGSGRTTP